MRAPRRGLAAFVIRAGRRVWRTARRLPGLMGRAAWHGFVCFYRSNDLTFLVSPNDGSKTINGEDVIVPDKEKATALYDAVRNDRMADWMTANGPKPSGSAQPSPDHTRPCRPFSIEASGSMTRTRTARPIVSCSTRPGSSRAPARSDRRGPRRTGARMDARPVLAG